MSVYFVDTSALVKRYLREQGSTWIRISVIDVENVLAISDITPVEMFSIFARRQRNHELRAAASARLQQAFLAHVRQGYLVVPIDNALFEDARGLAVKHGLKALDAIQLACALHARDALEESLTFLSADRELLVAAAAEGFAIDSPLDHP